ncbi:hypothetical protein [Dolichospermum sp. LEGE 00246]|uniref:hypothetical protein n=1 Tax=Dolichospermum sp. LEGE 00246 TaxID=1828605 RepID=UPI00351C0661
MARSEGWICVRVTGSPKSQLAKSAEKFSARNRQVSSYMKKLYDNIRLLNSKSDRILPLVLSRIFLYNGTIERTLSIQPTSDS